MKRIKLKLEYAIYGYDAREFMPVRYDNKLTNKSEFIIYKLKRAKNKLSTISH